MGGGTAFAVCRVPRPLSRPLAAVAARGASPADEIPVRSGMETERAAIGGSATIPGWAAPRTDVEDAATVPTPLDCSPVSPPGKAAAARVVSSLRTVANSARADRRRVLSWSSARVSRRRISSVSA